jgi:DNA modification methylase
MVIVIDSEFEKLIRPLTGEEYTQLEKNIVRDGIREPLSIWKKDEKEIILDGHHRFRISKHHNIPFQTREIFVENRQEAKSWIIKNQIGKRNLTAFHRVELAMILEPELKKIAKENQKRGGGDKKSKNWKKEMADIEPFSVLKELSKISGVSHTTVQNIKYIKKHADKQTQQKLRQGNSNLSIHKVYSQLKAKEKRQKIFFEQQKACKLIKPDSLWTITNKQKVIECNVLITGPPYGIIDQDWEPDNIEVFTKEWSTRWNICNASFIAIFWSQKYLWDGRKWFSRCFSNYYYQQMLIWHYPNNMKYQSEQGFKISWEPIFLFRKIGSNKKISLAMDHHKACIPQTTFNGVDYKQHPCQSPLSVMKWLIASLSSPNDLICDPFCGSGTTGIAALQLNRHFYGIEIKEEYIKLAQGRIAKYGILENKS